MSSKHALILAFISGLLATGIALLAAHLSVPAARAITSTTQTTLYAVADTTIDSAYPSANSGLTVTLGIKSAILPLGGRAYQHTLLRFDLSTALPADAVVDRAQLELYLLSAVDADRLELTAANLAEDWGEWGRDGVTWDTRPAEGDTIISGLSPTTGPLLSYLPAWDITAIVQDWQRDWSRNFGLVVRESEPESVFERTFASRECEGRACGTARLTVEYSLPATATSTASPTRPVLPSPTPSTTASLTPAATATGTPTPTETRARPTDTPTATPTSSPWPTPSATASLTAAATATGTPRPTATAGPSASPSATPTETQRQVATDTPTVVPGATHTPVATQTATPLPPGWFAATAYMDSWVDDSQPSANHGAEPTLVAGRITHGGPQAQMMSLLLFDVSDLPAHACVHNAIMELTQLEGEPAHLPMQLEALAGQWEEMQVTWANMPWAVDFGDAPRDVLGHAGLRTWDITSLAQGWANFDRLNYGLRLRSATLEDGGRVFASRHTNTPPQLTLQYEIDTTPPTAPTSATSSHLPDVWSATVPITVAWSGASDGAGCGVYGYSLLWDHWPATLPDTTLETTDSHTAYAAASGIWYLHIRTRDKAANWSQDYANIGAIKVDTTPPESAVSPALYYQGPMTEVSWSGSDAHSGLDSYDVQYRDGNGAWVDWRLDTKLTSATFQGALGHTYHFRSRARDKVGNVEAYPASPDLTFRVGRDLIVTVRNEYGALLPGARVIHDGIDLGVTGASGTIVAPNCVMGDTLVAMYQVHEQPNPRRPGDWTWRIYQTSIGFDGNGVPIVYQVPDLNFSDPPELTVRRGQTLFGFHIMLSVEWDADSAYLLDLAEGVKMTSDYIYDYTDGQFFWEQIDIVDDRGGWGYRADVRVHVYDGVRAKATVGGILEEFGMIYVGRREAWASSPTDSWTEKEAYRVLGHEFGHYGFFLWDEYLDADGDETAVGCASNFYGIEEARRASVMFLQWDATELCSRVNPAHTHNPDTWHDTKTGGLSTWQRVRQSYASVDPSAPWVLRTPVERGSIMAGPVAIPAEGMRHVIVTNYNTGACAPFDVSILSNGYPAKHWEVWIEEDPGSMDEMFQGYTDDAGHIEIYGAHNGDPLCCADLGMWGQCTPVVCSPGPTALGSTVPVVIETAPSPFTLQVSVIPVSATQIRVWAELTPTLQGDPLALVWQEGSERPITVTLEPDGAPGRYAGLATLLPGGGPEGHVRVSATTAQGFTAVGRVAYSIEEIVASEGTIVRSADGAVELVLPANSLSGDAVASIHRAPAGSREQDGLVRVGEPYEILVSSGQQALNGTAYLKMHYPTASSGVLTPTLGIYRWDEGGQRWVALGGQVNGALGRVSVGVSGLSVFALLGEPGTVAQDLYLPVVLKRR